MNDRPIALSVRTETIPNQLKQFNRWLCWTYSYHPQNSKPWTKVPINPANNHKASSTDSASWNSFDFCCKNLDRFDGLGFTLDKGLTGIDLDNCISDGKIAQWAIDVIKMFDSYTEVSPSGKGIRILVLGKLPGKGIKKDALKLSEDAKDSAIEVYDSGRYLTITGRALFQDKKIESRQEAIDQLYGTLTKDDAKPERKEWEPSDEPSPLLEDEEVIQRLRRREKSLNLWLSKLDGYPSQSEADQALCNLIAFYTQDEEQIDRIFRQSGLMRDKWDDREDYRTRTIDRAIDGLTAIYQPFDFDEQQFIQIVNEPYNLTTTNGASNMNTLISINELLRMPEPNWLIDGMLEEKTLCCLWGNSNVGKTFHALDMGLSVASGRDYHSKEVRQGNVIYLISEGWARFGERIKSWCEHYKTEFPEAFRIIVGSYNLTNPFDIKRFTDELAKHPPKLLIIDTMSFNFLGDEDRKAEVQPFINTLQTICSIMGVTVLLIHHPGKDSSKGERGSYAFRCALDTSIEVKATERDNNQVSKAQLVAHKQRNSDFFAPINLKRVKVGNSLVWVPGESKQEVARQETSSVARLIMEVVAANPGEYCQLDLTKLKVGGEKIGAKNRVEQVTKDLKEAGLLVTNPTTWKLKVCDEWNVTFPLWEASRS